jgi:hypothetical protein
MIVGSFNTPLSTIGHSEEKKINKETLELSNTTDQMDLTDICGLFHPTVQNIDCFQKPINLPLK